MCQGRPLSTAARPATEFDGVFGEETIELFLATSYDQFADRAKFNHFLPLIVERFARHASRLQIERHDGLPHGAVPLHPQRGEPDGMGWFETSSSPWAAGGACPLYPGKRYDDWELEDPAGLAAAAVRPIRDEIRERVEHLIASLDLT